MGSSTPTHDGHGTRGRGLRKRLRWRRGISAQMNDEVHGDFVGVAEEGEVATRFEEGTTSVRKRLLHFLISDGVGRAGGVDDVDAGHPVLGDVQAADNGGGCDENGEAGRELFA